MDTLQLDQNVSELVREQRKRTLRDEGSDPKRFPEWVTVPSLLDQLRAACKPGAEAGSGGGSDLKSPVALNALDLLIGITSTATEYFALFTQTYRTADSLEMKIQGWAANTRLDERAVATAERITGKWIAEIENLFDPPKRQQVNAPCPACENRYKYTHEAGEAVRSAAIQVTVLEGARSFAECGVCGARWERGQMHLLAEVLEAS